MVLHIDHKPEAATLHEWAHAIFRYLQTGNPKELPHGVRAEADTSTRHIEHVAVQHGLPSP